MRRVVSFLPALLALACDGGPQLLERPEPPGVTEETAPRPAPEVLDAPYPIVLVHGVLGARSYGPVDYWWKIPERLERDGERVFVSEQEPLRTPADRAVQLARVVDRALQLSGAAKVNLIAHSMGGLDARVLVSALGYGDRVASLTTVATPHHGSPVADLLVDGLGGSSLGRLAANAVGGFVALFDGDDQAALDTARALTTDAARDFNETHPDDPRVAYFSVIARSSASPFCAFDDDADCVEPALLATYLFLRATSGANDGMVPTDSGRWGEVVAEIASDHVNEVGHPLGVVGRAFHPWDFYAGHVRFLHARGF